MISHLHMPVLALPKNLVKQKRLIMTWFRALDERLVELVDKKQIRVELAQTYFKHKVNLNDVLSNEEKQTLARESRVWKIPS